MRLRSEHRFILLVENDANFYNYPIHYDDIKKMLEPSDIYKEINSLEEMYRMQSFDLQQALKPRYCSRKLWFLEKICRKHTLQKIYRVIY